MTTLEIAPYIVPAAGLGPENPLPVFRDERDDVPMELDGAVPSDDRRFMGWQTAFRVLPYRMQDSYTRQRSPRDLGSVVLENEWLRATFLPAVGGKLASLIHRPSGRELLHRNPVFQPANLALRNAWTSGGIEWNAGQPGHHYLTCSPIFAARVQGPDGSPLLRVYEWDRVKGFTWQVDFWLPEGSCLLFARTRIVNPHPHAIAMYWWTNIAVDEREDVRVVVPAETALCNPYWQGLQVVELPLAGGRDLTYSTQSPHAADFFSRIPDDRRRWIAAIGRDGTGFFETSTDMLRGRKLFCWGMGAGGRRWQEYLATPGCAYIEIQAGLARTQMECVPMPARAEWAWTEAMGLLATDPGQTHSQDWAVAWRHVGARIEDMIPRRLLERHHAALQTVQDTPPVQMLAYGSGWGALERQRRRRRGEEDVFPPGLNFGDDTLGEEQEPWLALLQDGVLPCREPAEDPGPLMTQQEWRGELESSVSVPAGDHWLAHWHLGNLLMEAREADAAGKAWERSLERCPTGWALRNLAVLASRRHQHEQALQLMAEAWRTGPKVVALAVELARGLAERQRFAEVLSFIDSLPADMRSNERLMLLWAQAAVQEGNLEDVERVFERDFATIREGEVSLTDLWFAYHERRIAAETGQAPDDNLRRRVRRQFPPPRSIDFRMATAPPTDTV